MGLKSFSIHCVPTGYPHDTGDSFSLCYSQSGPELFLFETKVTRYFDLTLLSESFFSFLSLCLNSLKTPLPNLWRSVSKVYGYTPSKQYTTEPIRCETVSLRGNDIYRLISPCVFCKTYPKSSTSTSVGVTKIQTFPTRPRGPRRRHVHETVNR